MTTNPSKPPLVSVVISCFNHAQFVEEAVLSVLRQSYPFVELIVVDDGSSDNSVPVLEHLSQKHGFRFYQQKNLGLSGSLNKAFELTQGEFFVPFGSDDVMFPHRIEAQVKHMLANPQVGISGGAVEIIDESGHVISCESRAAFRRLDFEDVFLGRKQGAAPATFMVRRDVFAKIGGFNPSIRLEDVYLTLRITRDGYFFDVLSDVLAQYRKHPTNTYKRIRYMHEQLVLTLSIFKDHPSYDQVLKKHGHSYFIKSFNKRDFTLAYEILRTVPLDYFNLRIFPRVIWILLWRLTSGLKESK